MMKIFNTLLKEGKGVKNLLQSHSISFAAVLMLAVISPLRAVVVPVELPENIRTAKDYIFYRGRINKVADSTIRFLNLRGVKDVVIIFTRNGRPAVPEDIGIHEDLTKLPARDLEPVRGEGWTDAEWSQILHVWNLAYPRLKRIYDWPYCKCGGWLCLGTHKVKITKDPSLGTGGMFIPSPTCWINSEIRLKRWESAYGRKWGPLLIHEMAHAFRNYRALPHDQFEEGHAEFAEVEVSVLIYEETGGFYDYPL
ncbi:MAG: hypothetical protein GXO39_04890 [Thermotogae bacterium]|nr:hypothetical protein [Thermotogota bacterium]